MGETPPEAHLVIQYLAYGTEAERAGFQIAGAGYGSHWPELDEDIGVEGLMLGKQALEGNASFARWLEQCTQSQPPEMNEQQVA